MVELTNSASIRFPCLIIFNLLLLNVRRIFEKHDSDSSGEVDFIEYITAMSTIIHGSVKEKLIMCFKIFGIVFQNYVSTQM